jgi:hypothetical protein
MLEDVFVDPAALQRLRSCVLGDHLDDFCTRLEDLGYARTTVRNKLSVIEDLARWMQEEQVAVGELDEQHAVQYVRARRRRCRRGRGAEWTLLQLIEQLRCAGVLPLREPTRDDSPATILLARYEEHLRRERALAPTTITAYRYFVRGFVERLGDVAGGLDALGAGEVRDILLVRVRRLAPRCAQVLGCALRSFLRWGHWPMETRMASLISVKAASGSPATRTATARSTSPTPWLRWGSSSSEARPSFPAATGAPPIRPT